MEFTEYRELRDDGSELTVFSFRVGFRCEPRQIHILARVPQNTFQLCEWLFTGTGFTWPGENLPAESFPHKSFGEDAGLDVVRKILTAGQISLPMVAGISLNAACFLDHAILPAGEMLSPEAHARALAVFPPYPPDPRAR